MQMAVIKGWKFPIQVDENTGKIKTVEDNENIKQSVRMILETRPHERKIVENFGTDLRPFMFEVISPRIISDLKDKVEHSIRKWENHIRDLHVDVQAKNGTVSSLNTQIDYITDLEPTQERVNKVITDFEQ